MQFFRSNYPTLFHRTNSKTPLFKMKYSMFAGAAAALISMVDAYTQPTGALGGNPVVLPSTNSPVTVGKPYTITWTVSISRNLERVVERTMLISRDLAHH